MASPQSRIPSLGLAAGVTLMEMLVVMALASIVLALVFPAVGSGLNTLALRSAGTRLAAAARYARDQAVYRQKTFALSIDPAAGEAAVAELDGSAAQRYRLPDGVRVQAVLPAESSPASAVRRFYFYPDGGAPQFEIVLANSRRRLTVAGDPLTGTAKVIEQ